MFYHSSNNNRQDLFFNPVNSLTPVVAKGDFHPSENVTFHLIDDFRPTPPIVFNMLKIIFQ